MTWWPYPRRQNWLLSDNGAQPLMVSGADRAMRGRALKSANASLEITEHDDHVLFEATAAAGGAPLDAWPVGSVYIAVDAISPATKLGGGTWVLLGSGRTLVGFANADPDFGVLEGTGGAKTHTLSANEMPAHTHMQDAHTHTQQSHNHTQDPHTHTQNSHTHPSVQVQGGTTAATTGTHIMTSTATGGSSRASTAPDAPNAATAVNQNGTATNQAATAVNNTATATNQNTGGGAAHNNLQPFIVVNFWKRTA